MSRHLQLVSENDSLPKSTIDAAGYKVDLSTPKWRLNSLADPHTLINWNRLERCNESAVAALRVHIVRLIETLSTGSAYNAFQRVASFLIALRDSDAPDKSITLSSLTWYLEELRKQRRGSFFQEIRTWYTSSTDRYLEGFSDELAFALHDLRIEGCAKGFAVLSSDPEEGPLSELEEVALRNALSRDNGPIGDRLILSLALAFGTNPANLALLQEKDFEVQRFDGKTPPAYFLNMPRIKKGTPERAEFKKRYLDDSLAALVMEQIKENADYYKNEIVRPLLRKGYSTNARESQYLTTRMVTYRMANYVALLGFKWISV